MSYTIIKSNGQTLTTINDGFLDTSTSLDLPGPNYVGYGRYLNENLVYLLENFASNTAPTGTSLEGQLWFDQSNKILKVFTSDAGYVAVSGVTNSGTEPIAAKDGDMWFNTTTFQVYIFNNGSWEFIGPQYTRSQGVSGAIPLTVQDAATNTITHNILMLQFGNTNIATFSTDPAFVVGGGGLPGFDWIYPGITLSANIAGTALNSNVVGNVTGNLTGDIYTAQGNLILDNGTDPTSSRYFGDVYSSLGVKILENGTNGTDSTYTGSVTGNLVGNVTSINNSTNNLVATNFSTGNAVITGGYINRVANIYASSGTIDNLSSSNILVSGGTMSVATLSANKLQANNFSTGNAVIVGGYINNLANLSATSISVTNLTTGTAVVTNFSTANAQISGGFATGLSSLGATLGTINNFSTGNAVITGGRISGVTSVQATAVTTATLSTADAEVTGGNITANISNSIITGGNLINTVATTQSHSDSTANVATTAFVQSVFPRGMIMMWNSSAATIPSGFQLCDGSNGTPDLRDRFIVGAGSSYTPGQIGGNASVTLDTTMIPPHIHGISINQSTGTAGGHTHTVNDPGHNHQYQHPVYTAPQSGSSTYCYYNTQQTDNTSTSVTGISLSAVADHSHNINISAQTLSTGGGQPHENRPPFYALCYIQKMF